jgi:PAS domain S-box-containing protein
MPLDLASGARLSDTLFLGRTARFRKLPFWLRHLLALVIVVIALLIRLSMDRWVGQDAVPYVVFSAAIAFSAFLWGRSPGLTATLASAILCDYFITVPRYEFNFYYTPGDLAPLLFFLATGLVLSLLAGHLHASWQLSRQRHQTLGIVLSSIGDAVIVADALGNVSFLNRIAEQLTGWSSADARGRKLSEVFRIIDETSRQPLESPVDKVLRTGDVVTFANHTLLLAKDGREIPIDDSGAPIRQDDGSIHGVILVFRDFSDRRRKEEAIQRLNRLLKARSASSRALLQATDETQYLQDVCRLAVEDCGYAMVWIGYAQDDAAKSIKPMAFAGKEDGYLQNLQVTWADSERGRGPSGTAIRTGKINRCHNMLDDPSFGPWRDEALKRGYASSIALPLFHEGKAFASLTIYSFLPDPFTPDEVQLLSELADDLAHGIQSIRLRAAHEQARELLRASEERLRFALEGMHAGTWEFDLVTHAAQRSLLHDQIFGYDAPPPQWSLETFLQHIIPEDRPWVERKIRDAIAAGNGWNFECRILRPDGAQRWIWICAQLYSTIAGKSTRAVGIVLDVTDRKATEEQFHLYLNAIQAAANAIVITDPKGTVQWVNPAFTRLTGYSAAEAIGNNPRVLNSKHHDDSFFQNMWQTILAGRVWQGEVVNRRKDGTTYVEEMTITPVTGAFGEIAHFIAIKQDVTVRKDFEHALRRQARLIDLSPDGIIARRLDGTILFWSKGAEALYGWTGQEALGKSTHELLRTQFPKPLQVIIEDVRRHSHWSGELVHTTKNGRQIVVQSYWTAQLDEQGDVSEIMESNVDITERKHAEQALARTAEELARSNHDLEQFAYIASHDLQEPLRMVSGYLQLLDRRYKDKLDQDAREFIDFAVDGASRMSRLITDLLDYSRINTRGKRPEPIALDTVLQRARENLAVSIRESGAEIVAGPPTPLPAIRGDPTQLVQLFQNLLGNALKFRSPQRPQRVCIQAEKTDDKWRISVADQGIGIDPQYAEKIFLIFQRLHSRAEYPGTGIGLALCKRIVERHGGKIWVEGRPGKGATFFFTLPAA